MKALVMAAGKGTRLQDPANPCPKVLKEALGTPLLGYVLATMPQINRNEITVITGFLAEKVEERYAEYGCRFQRQGDDAYGTGYAVMCGLKDSQFDDFDGDVLVINGDAPLTKLSTITGMIEQHLAQKNTCTLLSAVTDLKLPYGRIIRGEDGHIINIIEEKDCTPEQKEIKELNIGGYIFNCKALREGLSQINNNNKAGEYYITDVPPVLAKMGYKVDAFITHDDTELTGVNTLDDLKLVEDILKSRGHS